MPPSKFFSAVRLGPDAGRVLYLYFTPSPNSFDIRLGALVADKVSLHPAAAVGGASSASPSRFPRSVPHLAAGRTSSAHGHFGDPGGVLLKMGTYGILRINYGIYRQYPPDSGRPVLDWQRSGRGTSSTAPSAPWRSRT
jgi:hypothetical protein